MIGVSDLFYLDTDEGSIGCHVITTRYLDEYQHHYLIYEMDGKPEEVFVSIYQPDDDMKVLLDVQEKELESVIQTLESEEWI